MNDKTLSVRGCIGSIHTPIAILDHDMKYIMANPAWIADYDINEDLLGRYVWEGFPGIGDQWKPLHQRCLEGASVISEFDMLTAADRPNRRIRWEAGPWRNEGGEIGGIVIVCVELT